MLGTPCFQVPSTGLASIFLGAQPCPTKISSVKLYSITLHQYLQFDLLFFFLFIFIVVFMSAVVKDF